MNDLTKQDTNIIQSDPDSIMAVISRAAADPNTDVVKLEKMLDMYERITDRNSEAAFNAAMADVQSRITRVAVDSKNPQTHSEYASYAALDRVLRPIYSEGGFSLSFDTGEGAPQDCIRVLCYVAHNSGYKRTYHVDMPADGKGAKGGDVMTKTHATGSAMTYGQRYLLKGIFNVAIGEDNDGNSHVERITEGQVADLQCLIDEVKANKVLFLQYFKINKLEDMGAQALKDAIRLLEEKRKK